MSCFQKVAFSKRTVKKGTACREGLVSEGVDVKVYLQGSEKHHVASEKNSTNLFTYTPLSTISLLIHIVFAAVLARF